MLPWLLALIKPHILRPYAYYIASNNQLIRNSKIAMKKYQCDIILIRVSSVVWSDTLSLRKKSVEHYVLRVKEFGSKENEL